MTQNSQYTKSCSTLNLGAAGKFKFEILAFFAGWKLSFCAQNLNIPKKFSDT